jgi:glycerophosphoryl diester phosphodiesterase
VRRVGHKGADLVVPGNTPASFDAALAAGVDMIEFDVLPEDPAAPATSRLLLAHDYGHDLSGAPTLAEGLGHLASAAFDGIELDVDLKLTGYERRVVAALREHGLVERTLVSSQHIRSLDSIRAMEPGLRLGLSVPKVRRDYTDSRVWALPALGALAVLRRTLPRQAARAIRAGRCDALMAHHRLVTPALVGAVERAGGELYVWTVDDTATIASLERLGVSGVITNDPRLFGPLSAARTSPR